MLSYILFVAVVFVKQVMLDGLIFDQILCYDGKNRGVAVFIVEIPRVLLALVRRKRTSSPTQDSVKKGDI